MSRISIEDLVASPAPGMAVPAKVAFSPDGNWIAWLQSPERTPTRRLHMHEVNTGITTVTDSPAPNVDESTLSADEKLRRQRTRDLGTGVTTYTWSKQNTIVVPTTHSVWTFDPVSTSWTCLIEVADASIIDPQLSPDGSSLAWVQDGELQIAELATGEIWWMTEPIDQNVTHGLADYIAQEEMGRMHGYWWSPDSKRIAYAEVDERAIPPYRIAHTDKDPYAYEEHRYSFAGGINCVTKLFVVDVDTETHTELDITFGEYLARVHWTGNQQLVTEVQNRAQTELQLTRHNVDNGQTTVLHTETGEPWLNLHSMFRSLRDGGFIWASERSGYRHLEVRNSDGSLRTELTHGEWVVDVLNDIDESTGTVWFTATTEGPTQRHCYAVPLDGGKPAALAADKGTHRIAIDPHYQFYVDLHDDVSHRPQMTLRRLLDNVVERRLFDDVDPRIKQFDLQPPELRTVFTKDGTELHVGVRMPKGKGPFPTLVHVYGGPHHQSVRDTWGLTADLSWQYLRERGVCVVTIDNRGSSGRGLAFEAAISRDLGNIEVQDQADAIEILIKEKVVDPKRIATMGWSYGGYMAVMLMAQRPDLFGTAVGQALVSHWDGYDSHYTERYMGLPAENVAGYQRSSLMHHVAGIKGNLLLVHGMIDENVHFRHMTRLIDALNKAQIHYQFLPYPSERHAPVATKETMHLEAQTLNFVLDSLGLS